MNKLVRVSFQPEEPVREEGIRKRGYSHALEGWKTHRLRSRGVHALICPLSDGMDNGRRTPRAMSNAFAKSTFLLCDRP